jgi:hypothetical protein
MALAAALATWVTSSAVAAVLVLRRFATPCFPLIMGGIAVVVLTGNGRVKKQGAANQESCTFLDSGNKYRPATKQ